MIKTTRQSRQLKEELGRGQRDIHRQQAGGCPEEQKGAGDLGNTDGLGHVAEITPELTGAGGSHLQGFVGITSSRCRGNRHLGHMRL